MRCEITLQASADNTAVWQLQSVGWIAAQATHDATSHRSQQQVAIAAIAYSILDAMEVRLVILVIV